MENNDNVKISDLKLSVRVSNILKSHGYVILNDFKGTTQRNLLKIRRVGKKTAKEIVDCVNKYGQYIR